jgi:hypothetical protein
MSEWVAVLFFIGLMLVIAEHNSKEKRIFIRQRSKSI